MIPQELKAKIIELPVYKKSSWLQLYIEIIENIKHDKSYLKGSYVDKILGLICAYSEIGIVDKQDIFKVTNLITRYAYIVNSEVEK